MKEQYYILQYNPSGDPTEIPEKLMKRIRKKYSAGELISKVESERL